jgi:hypothetical protein
MTHTAPTEDEALVSVQSGTAPVRQLLLQIEKTLLRIARSDGKAERRYLSQH